MLTQSIMYVNMHNYNAQYIHYYALCIMPIINNNHCGNGNNSVTLSVLQGLPTNYEQVVAC